MPSASFQKISLLKAPLDAGKISRIQEEETTSECLAELHPAQQVLQQKYTHLGQQVRSWQAGKLYASSHIQQGHLSSIVILRTWPFNYLLFMHIVHPSPPYACKHSQAFR